MNHRRLHTLLLLQAGRLLLQYNESTEAIHRALMRTARSLTDESCDIAISYRDVAVSLAGEGAALRLVPQLRYNAAVQARVHEILEQIRRDGLEASAAMASLDRVEAETPRHPRWVAVLCLGAGAACLAALLGGDLAAAAVAGLATGLGLVARHELERWHFSLLALPLAAALIGAVLGGLAIQLGLTQTPELALIVPALMLVPGPHLINGLLDLIDNHLPMSLCRFGLAIGILLASALGIVLGVELTLPSPFFPSQSGDLDRLTFSDMALAGIVTCGFAVFYNTSWRHLWMAVLGGMAGNGLRFLALEIGCTLEAATFLGGLAVGAISAWMARSARTPVAVIAFAGTVTMIPGLNLYRALAGAMQLARLPERADATVATATLSNALRAGLVIGGLTLGLILGARLVRAFTEERKPLGGLRNQWPHEEASRPAQASPGDEQASLLTNTTPSLLTRNDS
jgi:uncharacterized membrane protein YjjP (DUF1212 family)